MEYTCDLSYLADKGRRVPALGQLGQHGRILSLIKLLHRAGHMAL